MQRPLEITFHNTDVSPTVEAEIRRRAEKLGKIYDRLTGCRVAVEVLHRQHRSGNVFAVHVELAVPGDELVVTREPHGAKERYASPNIRKSIHDAFDAAERQLKDFKQRQRGEIKPHGVLVHGQITQLEPDYGFILTNEGTQLYFHRNSVLNEAFNKLKRGDQVHFVSSDGDTGPIASKVWIGPVFHLD